MERFTIVYDCDLKRPACVILQAIYGGNRDALSRFFDSRDWLTAPTPGMKKIIGTEAEWKKAAEITKRARKR